MRKIPLPLVEEEVGVTIQRTMYPGVSTRPRYRCLPLPPLLTRSSSPSMRIQPLEAATVIVKPYPAVEVSALSPTQDLYQCNSSMSKRQILQERRTDPILSLSQSMELNNVQLMKVLQEELKKQQYHLEVAHLQLLSLQEVGVTIQRTMYPGVSTRPRYRCLPLPPLPTRS